MRKLLTIFAILATFTRAHCQGLRLVAGRVFAVANPGWTNLVGDYETKFGGILLIQTYKSETQTIPRAHAALESAGIFQSSAAISMSTEPSTRTYQIPNKIIAITNAQNYDLLAVGSKVTERAIRIGTVVENGETYELWDCGTAYIPPPPTPEQIKSSQAAAEIKSNAVFKAKQDAAKKVLKWNQDQAVAGDAYGQLRMGERYRDGNGVEKDLEKAREYFQKAAAQG